VGEIRVFYRDRFLCRAISADLAGQTVPLREIVNARKRRREQLRTIVKDRLKTVDTLLEFKRGLLREDVYASTVIPVECKRSRLKRYFNE
jgi:putative transposase